jgi:membrane-associated phospholipid phosphatase
MTLIIFGFGLASFGLAGLALRPSIDLAASGLFFNARVGFVGGTLLARDFRLFAEILPFIVYLGAILAYLAGLLCALPERLRLRLRGLIFLTSAFAIGPGFLVNSVFKTQFHRPRPVHVQQFGGEAAFRPFYRTDGACAKNCSFPSGETAAAFWTMAPAVLAPWPMRLGLMGAALLFGIATGLCRMAAGAHFLSDVLFSGWLTGLVIGGLWFLILRRAPSRRAQAK